MISLLLSHWQYHSVNLLIMTATLLVTDGSTDVVIMHILIWKSVLCH